MKLEFVAVASFACSRLLLYSSMAPASVAASVANNDFWMAVLVGGRIIRLIHLSRLSMVDAKCAYEKYMVRL